LRNLGYVSRPPALGSRIPKKFQPTIPHPFHREAGKILKSPHINNLRVLTMSAEVSISTEEIRPKHGVVTLFGYGISVRVDSGHLIIEDGIGSQRRRARFPRVGHGLKRLVVIGSDGVISLAALRWLSDQKAAFVMLDRTGKNIAVTGPVLPS